MHHVHDPAARVLSYHTIVYTRLVSFIDYSTILTKWRYEPRLRATPRRLVNESSTFTSLVHFPVRVIES